MIWLRTVTLRQLLIGAIFLTLTLLMGALRTTLAEPASHGIIEWFSYFINTYLLYTIIITSVKLKRNAFWSVVFSYEFNSLFLIFSKQSIKMFLPDVAMMIN